jgi:superfamily II DNA or RNA helicase
MSAGAQISIAAYLDRLEQGHDDPLPIDQLVVRGSMYESIEATRRLAGVQDPRDPRHPAAITGKFCASNLYIVQKVAIVRAIAYMQGVEMPVVVEKTATPKLTASDTAVAALPLGRRCAAFFEANEPSCQMQCLPCGIGKSCILAWVAVLAGSSVLLETHSKEQARQLTRVLLRETNVSKYFDVKLLATNVDSDAELRTELKSDEGLTRENLISDTSGFASRGHMLTHGMGILVTDVYISTNKERGAASRRDATRLLIGRCQWSLLLVDEVDAVLTPQGRQPVTTIGAPFPALEEDTGAAHDGRCRYRLMHKHMLGVSATMERLVNDQNLLTALGPVTYRRNAVELEDAGHLAKLTFLAVRCGAVGASWQRTHARRLDGLPAGMSQAKLACLDGIVRVFQTLGLKTMIFCESKLEFGLMRMLFGNQHGVHFVSGMGEGGERQQDIELFSKPVSSTRTGLWCSTSVCSAGLDFTDLSCVILLRAHCAPSAIRQRCGRASRPATPRCFCFDLLDVDEFGWVADATTETLRDVSGRRYDAFYQDGYGDRIRIVDDTDVLEHLRSYMVDTGVRFKGVRLDSQIDPDTIVTRAV